MDLCPDIFSELFDETAVDRGPRTLQTAVAVHERHRDGPFRHVVGALAVEAADLRTLAALVADGAHGPLAITLGAPGPDQLAKTLAAAEALPGVRVERVVVDLHAGEDATTVVAAIRRELGGRAIPHAVRLSGVKKGRAASGSSDLAADLTAVVAAGAPIEVAGVDRAVSDGGAVPWAERTGVLNVLLAADAARDGADIDEVQQILAIEDGLMEAVLLLDCRVREVLPAIGTAHLDDIVDDLTGLGLVSAADLGVTTG